MTNNDLILDLNSVADFDIPFIKAGFEVPDISVYDLGFDSEMVKGLDFYKLKKMEDLLRLDFRSIKPVKCKYKIDWKKAEKFVEDYYNGKTKFNIHHFDDYSKIDFLDKFKTALDIDLAPNKNLVLYEELGKRKKLILSPKEKDIVKKRYGLFDDCKSSTLETIGLEYKVTRERIRQLQNLSLKKLAYINKPFFYEYIIFIKKLLNEYGPIVSLHGSLSKNYAKILSDVLSIYKERDFKYDFVLGYAYSNKLSIDTVKKETLKMIKNDGKIILTRQEIENYLNAYLKTVLKNGTKEQRQNFKAISELCSKQLINSCLIYLAENIYKIPQEPLTKMLARNERMEYLFKTLYPKGVHLPINNDKELEVNLKELVDSMPELNNLRIRALSDRIFKDNPNIVWYDRGTYIHVDNLNPDWSLIDKAIKEIQDIFESGVDRLKPYIVYKKYKKEFQEGGIPSEIALTGLIRYKRPKGFVFHKNEIWDIRKGENQPRILELFEEFVSQFENGIKSKDLTDYFCVQRGWKPYQLGFLHARSNVIIKDGDLYIHKKFLK